MKLIANQEIEIGGQRYGKGQHAEAPAATAAALIAHGFARAFAPEPEPAAPEPAAIETAALKRGKKITVSRPS